MNKEELKKALVRGENIVIKADNETEGDFVVKELRKFGLVGLDSKLPSKSIISYPTYISASNNDWWTYTLPSNNLKIIEFEEFKKIVESEEDENDSKDNELEVGIVMEVENLELSEESKLNPPINNADNKYPDNPFDMLNAKKTPLHLYSIEELEAELNRRKVNKVRKLEETINKSFEELIKMGYAIHNVYSEDNMDGCVDISIEKKEILIG